MLSVKFSRFSTLSTSSLEPNQHHSQNHHQDQFHHFSCATFPIEHNGKNGMIESQNKGGKVDDWQPQVSCHLKNSTKTCFFGNKSPKTKARYIYITPPTVFAKFFQRDKVGFRPLRTGMMWLAVSRDWKWQLKWWRGVTKFENEEFWDETFVWKSNCVRYQYNYWISYKGTDSIT